MLIMQRELLGDLTRGEFKGIELVTSNSAELIKTFLVIIFWTAVLKVLAARDPSTLLQFFK